MNFTVLAPASTTEADLAAQPVWACFDSRLVDYIDEVSKRILGAREYRQFPELMALAFWMRKSNLVRLQQAFEAQTAGSLRLGRGLVFHIAPSNVDTIFVYSWFLSMLVGNTNIVRISSRSSPQIEALIARINEVSQDARFGDVGRRFLLVRYEHDRDITAHFSSQCDVRVIWGGDETINTIRAIPIGSKTTEITFADKFSFAVLRAEAVLDEAARPNLVQAFFNDAYWFDQLACSSPRVIFWEGDAQSVKHARSLFWSDLEKLLLSRQVQLATASAVDKLVAMDCVAITADSAEIEPSRDNLLNRVWLGTPQAIQRDAHCGQGLFYEVGIRSLGEIVPFVTRREQTMTVFGFERDELEAFVRKNHPRGIDRIVRVGEALNFSVIWDGYNLLREFTREVAVLPAL